MGRARQKAEYFLEEHLKPGSAGSSCVVPILQPVLQLARGQGKVRCRTQVPEKSHFALATFALLSFSASKLVLGLRNQVSVTQEIPKLKVLRAKC